MRIAVNNLADLRIPERRMRKACVKILKAEGARKDTVVSVSAVGEVLIQDMNRRYLSRESPTDVLSFPMGEEGGGDYLLGDVVVCPQYVLARRSEYDVEEGRELEFVVAHGVLHLLGYRDEDAEGASRMERRQREILGLAGRRGP